MMTYTQSIFIASASGDLKLLQSFLSQGANINSRDSAEWTPLMHAAANGHVHIVQYLIDAGANLQACDGLFRTAFELADENHHPAVAEIFSRFEFQNVVNDEGNPRFRCPFCHQWGTYGFYENNCSHYLASGDLFDDPFPILESVIGELCELYNELEEDIPDYSSAPDNVRKVLGFLGDSHSYYWQHYPDIEILSAPLDIPLMSTVAFEYFTSNPSLRAQIESEATEILTWLKKYVK